MNVWLWIGLPLLLLLGIFLNAIKDMKQLEKQLPKYRDKIREVKDDEDDDWPPAAPKPEHKDDKHAP